MGKELPNNWVEVQLIELLKDFENGKRPKGGVQGILEGIPSIGGEHLNSDGGFKFEKIKYIPKDFAEKITKGKIKQKDILIVKDGATTGKVSFVDDTFPFKYAFVNEHVFICRVFENVNAKALYYYLFGKEGQERILNNFTGSAQGGINQKFAKNTLIPLPPLPEQTRIVAKLDQLFGQLEQIKESLDKIPKLLKDFRQQVLTQAVAGKLIECNVEEKQLGKLLTEVKYGTSKKSEYEIEGTPIFRIPNISDGEIDDKDLKYSQLDSNEYEKLKLEVGDVLIIRSNGSISIVGKSAIVRREHVGFSYAGYLIRLKCSPYLNPEFLNYSLQSNFLRKQIVDKARSTSGVNNINSTEIKELNILIPSKIEEQQEIVNRIETLFAKADTIEQQHQALKQKIDTLPQALLHKAFKGELVPQLESDGDARELLEEIKKLKNHTAKPNTKKKDDRVSPSTSSGQAKVEPLKKSKAYKAGDVELGRVAEEAKKYSNK